VNAANIIIWEVHNMNKKRKRLRITLLLVCLVGALLANQVIAVAADDVTVEVSTPSSLSSAVSNGLDGDVVGVQGQITITSSSTFGNADKHITIKRMSGTSFINVNVEGSVLFENIIFEGDGITSMYPIVRISNNGAAVTFKNCIFKNCVSIVGGAIRVDAGQVGFRDCIFENNRASSGGHIAISSQANGATVNIENCTFTNGDGYNYGGAICNNSENSTCNINSSIITRNTAVNYGGGVLNRGIMNISNTKLFNNTTTNAGADIGNTGQLNIKDTLEELIALFQDEGIVPTGWVNDYDFETGVSLPDIDPSQPNSLLKLDYIIPPTEVVLDEASLGTADNEKITGLESGKYYKVTSGEVVSYAKADGTLTAIESEASPLDGNEIIGLTNGETYLVEEFTPAPTTVLLDSESLGIADNKKIIGLSAGKMYKVSVDGIINYTKADGTLTTDADEAEALTGTEIVGLTNGEIYLVEEYTPPTPEPEPDPNDDEDEEPTPDPNENPDPSPTPDPEPNDDDGDDQEKPTPKPTPTPNYNSGSGGSSYSSKPVVIASKAVVLSSGKAVLDTTKTEYLLGYTDGLLGNQGTVTRSQFVQIVYRLLTPESLEAVYSDKNNFKDISSKDWYNEAVSSLANAGLISVGTDKLFNPDKNITWGEMCTILSKFAKPNHEWKIITRHWARDSINTAISYRWFEYNDQFNPDGEVTRLEMLNFIKTMFEWTTK
jgi:hypothetical protein